MISVLRVMGGSPASVMMKKMVPDSYVKTFRVAFVLVKESTKILVMVGVRFGSTVVVSLEVANLLAMAFPTSYFLQEEAERVTLTLSGGLRILYLGSLSKHRYIVGVVKLWTIV